MNIELSTAEEEIMEGTYLLVVNSFLGRPVLPQSLRFPHDGSFVAVWKHEMSRRFSATVRIPCALAGSLAIIII
jgi:hypothetical protein